MFAADLELNGDVTLCLCQECTNSAKWVGELACVIRLNSVTNGSISFLHAFADGLCVFICSLYDSVISLPLAFWIGFFVLFHNWLSPLLIMQVQQLAIHAMLGLRLKQLAQVVASQLVLSYLTVRLSISICQGSWAMLVHTYSVMKMLNWTAWCVKRVCS
jgi:hypothetical protein